MVGVAQLVEHQVVALGVEGSSPFTHPIFHAPVAQPDRAPDFESVGRPFESGRAYQKNDLINLTIMVIYFLVSGDYRVQYRV